MLSSYNYVVLPDTDCVLAPSCVEVSLRGILALLEAPHVVVRDTPPNQEINAGFAIIANTMPCGSKTGSPAINDFSFHCFGCGDFSQCISSICAFRWYRFEWMSCGKAASTLPLILTNSSLFIFLLSVLSLGHAKHLFVVKYWPIGIGNSAANMICLDF